MGKILFSVHFKEGDFHAIVTVITLPNERFVLYYKLMQDGHVLERTTVRIDASEIPTVLRQRYAHFLKHANWESDANREL